MKLLGIDPGTKTGVALVEGEHNGAMWAVHWSKTCDLYDLYRVLLDVRDEINGVAVEWWEYQGQKRAQGCAYQANYSGYATGLAEGVGAIAVTMTRTQILKALGLKRNAAKRSVRETVGLLTVGARPSNEHEADAVAVVLATAGRFNGSRTNPVESAGASQSNRQAGGHRH